MKKYLQQFTRKDITTCLLLLGVAIAGARYPHWWGGFFCGMGTTCILLVLLGKRLAMAAIARIDKQIKDHIVNNAN